MVATVSPSAAEAQRQLDDLASDLAFQELLAAGDQKSRRTWHHAKQRVAYPEYPKRED